ncbi:MAG TPA: hypothetical protein DF613_15250 [Lachnospiraceae bacterium]|nr:hypothetical protein [Lachnospiraceae bacterium]
MRKKLISGCICISMLTALLAGCGDKGGSSQSSSGQEASGQEASQAAPEASEPEEAQSVQSGGDQDAAGGDKYVIGVSISGYQAPYFVAMVDVMEAKAKEMGNVELKILDAEWDTQKQASQVESLIEQKCDLIEIVPCDSEAIIPTMQMVKDAGIPLFVVNTQHDEAAEDLITTFIGASMEDEAAMCADSIINTFNGEECNLVIIEGAAGSFPAIHRTSGFEAAVEGQDNIHILAKQNCGWDRPTAQQTMDDFLTRYDNLNAVFAQDDNMAIGVIQALKAAGRLDEVKVFSISGTIEGVDAVKAGEMVSTVDQSPQWEGEAAVEYAVKCLEGETLDKWIKTPIADINKENADQFSPAW